ncbi:MAG: TetR/AcrR family transcriptional regulator [Spirochaetales bacterium]|nr:TetR/AcrR family transcriptional regulator [Spirochaetales bacterium]
MEEKKERTIEKAREYFHQYWYRKASLSDLIAEIGISKPTFYNYFRNKEELFDAVMVATYNEFLYEFNQRTRTARSAMEKLDVFVRTYAWFLDQYPLYRDLYRPGSDLLPRWLKSRHSKDLFAEGVETLKAIIEEGREQGIFREDLDPGSAALALCQLITVGLAFDPGVYSRRDRPPYRIHLDTLLGILTRGLAAPE